MRGLSHEEDPNDQNGMRADGPITRPRRDLIDRIPKVLEISVGTRNGVEATVKVLPSWREKGVLQIELTQENMDLLLEDPPAASAQFVPSIIHPDVTWVAGRNHVRCQYWNSQKKSWKIKSKLIEFDPHSDTDAMQELVDREAEAMQRFFLDHHNRLGDMPCNDESAESSSEEPPAKKVRCSGSEGNRFATASAESALPDANNVD